MEIYENERVQSFLDELKIIDFDSYEVIMALRKIILATIPAATEKMMYGGLVFFSKATMFSGLFAYKTHVSLEFSTGYLMEDPNKLLEGKGKYRRHLKFKTQEEIPNKNVVFFVEQAIPE